MLSALIGWQSLQRLFPKNLIPKQAIKFVVKLKLANIGTTYERQFSVIDSPSDWNLLRYLYSTSRTVANKMAMKKSFLKKIFC